MKYLIKLNDDELQVVSKKKLNFLKASAENYDGILGDTIIGRIIDTNNINEVISLFKDTMQQKLWENQQIENIPQIIREKQLKTLNDNINNIINTII